jgi:ABC-2 type transport system ATP-binding protein
MDEFAIRTDELTRRFGAIYAVQDLTLRVPRGIVFGFLGPNGSGKTTTIHLLLGLLRPTRGEAQVLGYNSITHGHEIRRQTGALLEHAGLYERLSAWENLEFYGRVARLPQRQRADRIEQLLTHLGLWDRRHQLIDSWSRGMKQKLAIARTLLHRPPLIFLDEPTAGLDPVASAALREDLADLAAESGVTVFLTTHHLAEAEKLCTQVGVIHRGTLLAVGPPQALEAQRDRRTVIICGEGFTVEMINHLAAQPDVLGLHIQSQNGSPYISQELHLQLPQQTRTADIIRYLVQAGAQIEEVRQGSESLEEVFLALVNGMPSTEMPAPSAFAQREQRQV